jgi:hypothetical protein
MPNFNTSSNQNQNIFQSLVLMDAILRSIGILQQMSIRKFLQRKNIFVLIVNNNLNQQLPLQHHQQAQLITIKNHGPRLNQNQKCPIPVNY